MASSKMARSTWVTISLCILLMLSSNASALSSWREDGDDFLLGEKVHTQVSDQSLRLDKDIGASLNWTLVKQGRPTTRYNSAMAYDGAHHVSILFGGFDGMSRDDTWAYDTTDGTWTKLFPPSAPFGRTHHSMAYYAEYGVTVLFGGSGAGGNLLNDTHAYDMGSNTWTNKGAANAPSRRTDSTMAYDALMKLIVLFGGLAEDGSTRLNDTWVYNMTANRWTRMDPPTAPSPRYDSAMAYDASVGRTVLFGGRDATGSRNDTWMFNAVTNEWTNVTTGVLPGARQEHGLVYDPDTMRITLFGGYVSSGGGGAGVYSDTWAFNSSSSLWIDRAATPYPAHSTYPLMTYDTAAKKTVMFTGTYGETWTYEPTTAWHQDVPTDMPTGRAFHAMDYDPINGVLVTFGGHDNAQVETRETWTFNIGTRTWKNMNPVSPPAVRKLCRMVYDPDDGVFVLFGGGIDTTYNGTWRYNASTNEWTIMNPPTAPSARYAYGMAYDTVNHLVVLFGGRDAGDYRNDTWIYNVTSNNWTQLTPPTAPSPRAYFSLSYDKANGTMVLFGGSTETSNLGDTWTFNLTTNTWRDMAPATAPSARTEYDIVYDDVLGASVLFGGNPESSTKRDTWTYSAGTNKWTQIMTATAPSSRDGHAMAYDSRNKVVVLFGGQNWYPESDVWAFGLSGYFTSGTYSTATRHLDGNAYFGRLWWNATISSNTTIKFQVRGFPSNESLIPVPFTGPDGTASTYYTTNGQCLHSSLNGSIWVEYKAFLSTTNTAETPILKDVALDYNLIHSLNVTRPAEGNVWSDIHNITWDALDPDNDTLMFDVYLENATGSDVLALNLANGTRYWTLDPSTMTPGTYRIRVVARDDNPYIPLNVTAYSGNFTVINHVNRPPSVTLLYPSNGSAVNTTDVTLSWTGSDPDGDPLNYTLAYSDQPFVAKPRKEVVTTGKSYPLTGLIDRTYYYWTVIANDGNTSVGEEVLWTFEVILPVQNHPPRITSTPPTMARVGEMLVYNVTAEDEDNDLLTFALVTPIAGMQIDPITGRFTWTPTAADEGDRRVWITVSDPAGNSDAQMFPIAVVKTGQLRPVCTITSPRSGDTAKGRIPINGTAVPGSLPIVKVQIRIDGGQWMDADGTDEWRLELDTGTLSNGRHTIEAKAYDGSLYSDISSVEFVVTNPGQGTTMEGPQWCLIMVLTSILILATGLILWYAKRKDGGRTGRRDRPSQDHEGARRGPPR